MSRTPMAERAFSRARKSRRDDAPQKSNSFGLPRAREQPEISHSSCAGLTRASIKEEFSSLEKTRAAQPTLVVKMSDTSLW
jgi:hypothetical protein